MTKAELIEKVAQHAGLTKKLAEAAINATFEEIKKADKFVLPGFGSFGYKDRPARTCRNPQTGKPMKVAAKKVFSFKASKTIQK